MAEINGTDVICKAMNDALLGGLVTVYHVERSTGSLENPQNTLPVYPNPPPTRALSNCKVLHCVLRLAGKCMLSIGWKLEAFS